MATTRGIDTGIPMTAEELLRLPRGRARFELIRGELRVMEPGFFEHGRVAVEAAAALHRHVRDQDLGGAMVGAETGFVIASRPDTVRAPDAAWMSPEHVARVGEVQGYWPGAPDFAVEVVSSGDRYSGVHAKALAWIEAGCRLLLVIDPDSRSATAYRPGRTDAFRRDDVVDCSDVVPGLAPRVAELLGL